MIGALVDLAIPLAGGGYITLLAFRKVGPKPGEKAAMDKWHGKYGKYMKVLGPLTVGFAVVVFVAKIAS